MSYSLGVDLGTTFVAAATARRSGAEMVTLAPQSVVAPALVYLREDGTLITGDAARRRAIAEPDRVSREFKRRLGDPTPIMLGGQSFAVTELLAALLRDVLRQVMALEGEPPERVVLTHPANWGPFRRGLFEEVPARARLSNTRTITEPEAAAAHYAATRSLREGQIVAVYDLGGGTFDATILRGGVLGVEILGRPEGIDRLGGVDFDTSVWDHVNYMSGGALDGLDLNDPQIAHAMARLRQDCVLAKESLSIDTEAIIPVFLPDRHFEVTLTRSEFDGMVRAPIESTAQALLRTLGSANLKRSDLSAVLLVGGSSRIPLVAQMVGQQLGCATVVDSHPKYSVALGAATTMAQGAVVGGDGAVAPGISAITPARGRVSYVAPRVTTRPAPAPTTAAPPAAPRPAVRPAPVASSSGAPQPAVASAAVTASAAAPTPAVAASRVAPPASAPATASGGGSATAGAGTGFPNPRAASNARSGSPPGAEPGQADLMDTPPRRQPAEWRPGPQPPGNGRSHSRNWFLALGGVLLLLAVVLVFVVRPGSPTSGPIAAPEPAPASAPPVVVVPTVLPAASVPNPTVAGVIRVAPGPQAGAITPDGTMGWVTSTNTNSITLIDMATDAVAGAIPISAGPPQYVAFTPDGRYAYVSVYDELRHTGNAVVVVDTASRAVVASIPAEKFPYAIAVSPDGRKLYVPNHDVNLVSVVDTATNTVIQKISVKPNPHSVAFSINGRRAYVANHASNLVTVLDTKNGAILAEIPVGRSPHSIAMSPDRSRVYVVNYDADSVSVIDPAANTVTATIPVQREPQNVAFAPDARHAYVVNDGSNTVSVIDTATNQVTATVGVGQDPTHVFLAPDGKHAYVTNISSNDVTVLNTAG